MTVTLHNHGLSSLLTAGVGDKVLVHGPYDRYYSTRVLLCTGGWLDIFCGRFYRLNGRPIKKKNPERLCSPAGMALRRYVNQENARHERYLKSLEESRHS